MHYFAMPHTLFILVLIPKLNAKGNIIGMPGSAEKVKEVEERRANESGSKREGVPQPRAVVSASEESSVRGNRKQVHLSRIIF